MTTLVKYLSPITIDSTNDTFDITITGVGTYTVDVADGTYYIFGTSASDGSLLKALKTALDAATSKTFILTLSSNKVAVGCAGFNFSVADPSSEQFPFEALGHSSGAITSSATSFTFAYQHQYAWVSTQAPETMEPDEAYEGVAQNVAAGKTVWTVRRGSTGYRRLVEHAYEPIYKLYPTTSYENQDWQSFLSTANDGQTVRFFEDSTSETYGSYVLSAKTIEKASGPRYDWGVARYSWGVELLKYVA